MINLKGKLAGQVYLGQVLVDTEPNENSLASVYQMLERKLKAKSKQSFTVLDRD